MTLMLLGAPGVGKGTQGALLTERLGLRRIATGDLLREAVRDGTPLGRKARGFMDAGELVPDDVILGMVREVLEKDRTSRGFILDGFPRTIAQAQALGPLLREAKHPLDAVVVIDVPDDVLVRRLSGRRTCASCGAVYNVYSDAPAQDGVCDNCGGTLVQRSDDSAETVRRRLEVYREQTEPLVAFYRKSSVPVRMVDGDRDVEAVHDSVLEAIGR